MKPMISFFCLFLAATVQAEDNSSVSVAKSAAAAISLAETVPLLTVNLNDYKHHANPVLTGGEKGQWGEAGIERVAVIRLNADDWRMWYSCTGPRRSNYVSKRPFCSARHFSERRPPFGAKNTITVEQRTAQVDLRKAAETPTAAS